jgi:spore coat protein JC
MWKYSKKLQFPVNIRNKNLKMAKAVISQYGGPQGELGAAIRYLNQRYTMPDEKGKALLNDIGTEELAHVEMICTMVSQMMAGATPEEIKAAGLEGFYTEHGVSLFPNDANGIPWTAAYISTTGDPIADLEEDLAAEQKARAVYESLIDLATTEDILGPLLWLRQREIVHFNRFKELLDEYKRRGLK